MIHPNIHPDTPSGGTGFNLVGISSRVRAGTRPQDQRATTCTGGKSDIVTRMLTNVDTLRNYSRKVTFSGAARAALDQLETISSGADRGKADGYFRNQLLFFAFLENHLLFKIAS